jgi:translation initiation factor 1 (eIF-1/SUI1)
LKKGARFVIIPFKDRTEVRITGVPDEQVKIAASVLKSSIACGGTFKEGRIMLQSVRVDLMRWILQKLLVSNGPVQFL